MKPKYVGRWLYTPEGAVPGYLKVVDGQVLEVCEGAAPSEATKAVVLPAFVNSHTHIVDSVAFPAPKGTVEQLVGPPDGYKHKVLRSVTVEDKIRATRTALDEMTKTGTRAFVDFREEGLEGVEILRRSLNEGSATPMILGRPKRPDTSKAELQELLSQCDGLGMSAARDWPRGVLEDSSREAYLAGKAFALHASETAREDIDHILALKPSFLVHMTAASGSDYSACADHNVPVVVCPRSNEFFGLVPDISRMIRAGVHVALGTDNGMISRPDMVEEIKAAYRISAARGGLTPAQIVYLATYAGRKVLNAKVKITTEIEESADLVVVDVRGEDPLREVVTSARSDDISAVVSGGMLRRPGTWRR
jgi:cytosine/adenosine deaminase-related metal-dependent hydrolase